MYLHSFLQNVITCFTRLIVVSACSLGLTSACVAALPDDVLPLSDSDFRIPSEQSAKLGQLLFYDKILSGNRNISCASCHHPDHATSDGLSLGIGEGGAGLGLERSLDQTTIKHRMTRNSPALFNLGANEFVTLFHDGRLSKDESEHGGFNSPAEEFLPTGLNSIVSAQALFPITSAIEMAGDLHENEVAGAVRRRIDYAWTILSERIKIIPEYSQRFIAAYPDIQKTADISIVHIANALGDFIAYEWRADNSAFDRYLQGNKQALNQAQLKGMELFYGRAECSNCHAGALQTDHQFHSLALPQFGPGRTRRFDFKARDMGRINESDEYQDAYRFRTPSLRNVEHTAPYGHNGAYLTLQAVIRHHAEPIHALHSWDRSQIVLPDIEAINDTDFIILADTQEQHRLEASLSYIPTPLSDSDIESLVDFLSALTDQHSIDGRLGIPGSVPSHLSIDP